MSLLQFDSVSWGDFSWRGASVLHRALMGLNPMKFNRLFANHHHLAVELEDPETNLLIVLDHLDLCSPLTEQEEKVAYSLLGFISDPIPANPQLPFLLVPLPKAAKYCAAFHSAEHGGCLDTFGSTGFTVVVEGGDVYQWRWSSIDRQWRLVLHFSLDLPEAPTAVAYVEAADAFLLRTAGEECLCVSLACSSLSTIDVVDVHALPFATPPLFLKTTEHGYAALVFEHTVSMWPQPAEAHTWAAAAPAATTTSGSACAQWSVPEQEGIMSVGPLLGASFIVLTNTAKVYLVTCDTDGITAAAVCSLANAQGIASAAGALWNGPYLLGPVLCAWAPPQGASTLPALHAWDSATGHAISLPKHYDYSRRIEAQVPQGGCFFATANLGGKEAKLRGTSHGQAELMEFYVVTSRGVAKRLTAINALVALQSATREYTLQGPQGAYPSFRLSEFAAMALNWMKGWATSTPRLSHMRRRRIKSWLAAVRNTPPMPDKADWLLAADCYPPAASALRKALHACFSHVLIAHVSFGGLRQADEEEARHELSSILSVIAHQPVLPFLLSNDIIKSHSSGTSDLKSLVGLFLQMFKWTQETLSADPRGWTKPAPRTSPFERALAAELRKAHVEGSPTPSTVSSWWSQKRLNRANAERKASEGGATAASEREAVEKDKDREKKGWGPLRIFGGKKKSTKGTPGNASAEWASPRSRTKDMATAGVAPGEPKQETKEDHSKRLVQDTGLYAHWLPAANELVVNALYQFAAANDALEGLASPTVLLEQEREDPFATPQYSHFSRVLDTLESEQRWGRALLGSQSHALERPRSLLSFFRSKMQSGRRKRGSRHHRAPGHVRRWKFEADAVGEQLGRVELIHHLLNAFPAPLPPPLRLTPTEAGLSPSSLSTASAHQSQTPFSAAGSGMSGFHSPLKPSGPSPLLLSPTSAGGTPTPRSFFPATPTTADAASITSFPSLPAMPAPTALPRVAPSSPPQPSAWVSMSRLLKAPPGSKQVPPSSEGIAFLVQALEVFTGVGDTVKLPQSLLSRIPAVHTAGATFTKLSRHWGPCRAALRAMLPPSHPLALPWKETPTRNSSFESEAKKSESERPSSSLVISQPKGMAPAAGSQPAQAAAAGTGLSMLNRSDILSLLSLLDAFTALPLEQTVCDTVPQLAPVTAAPLTAHTNPLRRGEQPIPLPNPASILQLSQFSALLQAYASAYPEVSPYYTGAMLLTAPPSQRVNLHEEWLRLWNAANYSQAPVARPGPGAGGGGGAGRGAGSGAGSSGPSSRSDRNTSAASGPEREVSRASILTGREWEAVFVGMLKDTCFPTRQALGVHFCFDFEPDHKLKCILQWARLLGESPQAWEALISQPPARYWRSQMDSPRGFTVAWESNEFAQARNGLFILTAWTDEAAKYGLMRATLGSSCDGSGFDPSTATNSGVKPWRQLLAWLSWSELRAGIDTDDAVAKCLKPVEPQRSFQRHRGIHTPSHTRSLNLSGMLRAFNSPASLSELSHAFPLHEHAAAEDPSLHVPSVYVSHNTFLPSTQASWASPTGPHDRIQRRHDNDSNSEEPKSGHQLAPKLTVGLQQLLECGAINGFNAHAKRIHRYRQVCGAAKVQHSRDAGRTIDESLEWQRVHSNEVTSWLPELLQAMWDIAEDSALAATMSPPSPNPTVFTASMASFTSPTAPTTPKPRSSTVAGAAQEKAHSNAGNSESEGKGETESEPLGPAIAMWALSTSRAASFSLLSLGRAQEGESTASDNVVAWRPLSPSAVTSVAALFQRGVESKRSAAAALQQWRAAPMQQPHSPFSSPSVWCPDAWEALARVWVYGILPRAPAAPAPVDEDGTPMKSTPRASDWSVLSEAVPSVADSGMGQSAVLPTAGRTSLKKRGARARGYTAGLYVSDTSTDSRSFLQSTPPHRRRLPTIEQEEEEPALAPYWVPFRSGSDAKEAAMQAFAQVVEAGGDLGTVKLSNDAAARCSVFATVVDSGFQADMYEEGGSKGEAEDCTGSPEASSGAAARQGMVSSWDRGTELSAQWHRCPSTYSIWSLIEAAKGSATTATPSAARTSPPAPATPPSQWRGALSSLLHRPILHPREAEAAAGAASTGLPLSAVLAQAATLIGKESGVTEGLNQVWAQSAL